MSAIVWAIVPLGLLAWLIFSVVRRGYQFRQLLEDGVETTAAVTRKVVSRRRRRRPESYFLRYEYRDGMGEKRTHQSVVTEEVWNRHVEGGPLDVVYSRSQPAVSAPKYLVDRARSAKPSR